MFYLARSHKPEICEEGADVGGQDLGAGRWWRWFGLDLLRPGDDRQLVEEGVELWWLRRLLCALRLWLPSGGGCLGRVSTVTGSAAAKRGRAVTYWWTFPWH